MNKNDTYCGFISIVGRPNVGKSTLMNHLIGHKISITSRKPQTTRHKVNGVATFDNYQYVFVDTPGFQKLYLNKLNKLLNESVVGSLSGVDAILFVVEAGIFNQGDEEVLALLPQDSVVVLVVNKIDEIKDRFELNNYIEKITSKFNFAKTILVAAKHHTGVNDMLEELKVFIPDGMFLYPVDQLTNRSSKFLVAEIIREKLFRYLGEELPYSMAVEIDTFKVTDKIAKIQATVIIDKENQKGMVIGKNGDKLKKISSEARVDMENLLGSKVFLQVWVKVKSGFADEAKFLAQFEE